MNTSKIHAPILTQRAPRSLRVRLGGYAVLPRLIDKCRAALTGMIGEYHTNCPLDRQFLDFAGIDYEGLRAELGRGASDGEILNWITQNAKSPRTSAEIEAWSDYQERRQPSSDQGTRQFFADALTKLSTTRTDIHSWADLLDLDDYVSFGGVA